MGLLVNLIHDDLLKPCYSFTEKVARVLFLLSSSSKLYSCIVFFSYMVTSCIHFVWLASESCFIELLSSCLAIDALFHSLFLCLSSSCSRLLIKGRTRLYMLDLFLVVTITTSPYLLLILFYISSRLSHFSSTFYHGDHFAFTYIKYIYICFRAPPIAFVFK